MERVLELYHQPYDPQHPVVCFDETNKQLLADTRPSLSPAPGVVARSDYAYERHGTRNLFLFFEPLRGWRHVKVTSRRAKPDFAQCMYELASVHYPNADRIRVVLDNLNTHRPAVLYETFAPAEAKRILDRLEFYYTPKHGSWLRPPGVAEIELSVLARQCLDRRIPDEVTLVADITAWQLYRNTEHSAVDWQFSVDDARIKLKRLYPSL